MPSSVCLRSGFGDADGVTVVSVGLTSGGNECHRLGNVDPVDPLSSSRLPPKLLDDRQCLAGSTIQYSTITLAVSHAYCTFQPPLINITERLSSAEVSFGD